MASFSSRSLDAMPVVEDLKATNLGVHAEDHAGPAGFGMTTNVRERLSKGGQKVLDDLVGEGRIDRTAD